VSPVRSLWGAQRCSCSSSVLVQETAKQIASVDSGRLIVADDSQSRTGRWDFKRQRPVRAMGVVVRDVDPKGLLEVASADDQQPVQTLGADGLHPALRVRVRLGRLHWDHEHLDAFRPEHCIEAVAELGIPVAFALTRGRRLDEVVGACQQPRTGHAGEGGGNLLGSAAWLDPAHQPDGAATIVWA
jgi:hypothetical protein